MPKCASFNNLFCIVIAFWAFKITIKKVFLFIDVGLGGTGVQVGSDVMPRSWSIFISFMLFCALNLSFMCASTFIIPLFSPICVISSSTMIQNNVSMAKGQFLHHYGALLSPWRCAVSQCDRTTVNLPLYTVAIPIYFRPPSFFLYRSSSHVCFLETQPLIELTYMGSRVV